ncbi:hypothetical protein EDD16DRAFT_1733961, partial [Pisolithus croceorrhizus]
MCTASAHILSTFGSFATHAAGQRRRDRTTYKGGRHVKVEEVEATAADADDRVGEGTFEFEVCNLRDRRGVDGGPVASVRELRVRDGDNTGRFPGLEGRVGVGPVSAIGSVAVPASSPATDDVVSPPLKGNEVSLVGDSFCAFSSAFQAYLHDLPACSKAERT